MLKFGIIISQHPILLSCVLCYWALVLAFPWSGSYYLGHALSDMVRVMIVSTPVYSFA